ncbi:MAG: glycerol-3-phosphate 1-O-acyltransferase PlsY [Spirochaetes bacterium]|nr:glycerol-3-phosphate 1-O-acyltransferase PlsY [Spirochaetota bacterium]
MIKVISLILLSYITGSIPFSYIICKQIKGIDIRTVGSKNAGATNAGRVLGKAWFFIITILDALKGVLVILLVQYLLKQELILTIPYLPVICGVAVILGHTYSLFLKFKGGKGVAVSAGVLLMLDHRLLLISVFIFIITVAFSKYISLGSILASIILPVNVLIFYRNNMDYYFLIFCTVISAYVIYKHRENIKRLLSRTERKWGEKINKK